LSEKDKAVYIRNKTEYRINISGNNNTYINGKNLIVGIFKNEDAGKYDKSIGEIDELLRSGNLTGAIRGYENILKSISSEKDPDKYSHVHANLGNTYLWLAITVNKEENALKEISSFEEVLNIATTDRLPSWRNKRS
jgi:hypothetical protein